jgi:transposase-like protein
MANKREAIISLFNNGTKPAKISALLGIAKGTVTRTLKKFRWAKNDLKN